jgi:transketolase N-terminal domain/subunit
MKPNTQQLNDLIIQVRRDILRMVHAVNSGHPGSKYNGPQRRLGHGRNW